MQAMEIARQLAELGQRKEASQAYKLALNECNEKNQAAEFECALHILQFGDDDDYKISYSCFVDLFNQGFAQPEILAIMDQAFYQPNVKMLQKRYEKNCKLLRKYPYIFRKDFLPFDELPIVFFPYDDNQYTPFYIQKQNFGDYINFRQQVISRNFFKDLDKPVLADDVFSQYELEYLVDNVRKSEWVARENHIYLHYTNWPEFCAYLQCLDLAPLLKEKKIVFLIEEEIEQYPIDFLQRFGIDYSQYEVKPLGIREINRLIWHTQLSAHNGGDFFNEIFDAHPNLLCQPSLMFDDLAGYIKEIKIKLSKISSIQSAVELLLWDNLRLVADLYKLSNRTEKDILVAIFLNDKNKTSPKFDKYSRIVPAIFFQPHFPYIQYELLETKKGQTQFYSKQYEQISNSPLFKEFKYIKTFTPLRSFTTSYGATIKFKFNNLSNEKNTIIDDVILNRIMNRSFMIDWQDRLFKDSVVVRFEDGKLNPKATFTALANFLDLPYTDSMTYCSLYGELNPESLAGNDVGFSTAAIYRTYDEYANDSERAFIEYFMRDAYEYYGYDFKYYDGRQINLLVVQEWLSQFNVIDSFMLESIVKIIQKKAKKKVEDFERENLQKISEKDFLNVVEKVKKHLLDEYIQEVQNKRLANVDILLNTVCFVNKNGQPLRMMPLLKLDPELLEQPLYR